MFIQNRLFCRNIVSVTLTVIALLCSGFYQLSAQSTTAFNFQAIARDAQGQPVTNRTISVRASILNASNTTVYVETHANVSTGSAGIFTLSIGRGTVSTGTNLDAIGWSAGNFSLRIEVDAGTGFQLLQTAPLLNVPYALYAKTAGSVSGGMSGSGTTGTLPKFTNSTTLGNSIITESSGKIGIGGTPSTSATLDVVLSSSRSIEIGTAALGLPTLYFNTGSANNIIYTGNQGTLGFIGQPVSIGINVGVPNTNYNLEVNGTAAKTGGGSWANPSDERLKKNVKPFTDGLEALLQIRPVIYHYNGKMELDSTREYVGVIAQQIQSIAPYMVEEFKGRDGQHYLSFDGSALTYISINAIQEQQATILTQQAKIKTLEAQQAAQYEKIKILEAQFAQLQSQIAQLYASQPPAPAKSKAKRR